MHSRFLAALVLVGCGGLGKDPVPEGEAPVPPVPTSVPTTVPETIVVTNPTNGEEEEVEVPSCSDSSLPDEAEVVFGTRCSACHGPDSQQYAGFGSALDPAGMIAGDWIVPGDAANSRIGQVIQPGPNGEDPRMPTAEGGGPLVASEVGIITQWINCGAEDWNLNNEDNETPDGARGLLTQDMLYAAALDDVLELDDVNPGIEIERVNARYFSLVHLYNAGVPSERLELYGKALSKLVWHLTAERSTPPLTPVQMDGVRLDDGSVVEVANNLGDKLLFRVDQRKFAWENENIDDPDVNLNVDAWEEMMKLYPYAVNRVVEIDDAEELVEETLTRIPIVNGDWFAANASLPPLYDDVLDVPNTIDEFYDQFGGINIQEDLDNFDVDCAGMDGQQTLVSNFNRVSCRHAAQEGYCYESYDFAGQVDEQNIFAFPNEFFLAEDGGEAFCALPNGMQAYIVYAAAGDKLAEAPIAVVSDYNPDSGGVVKPGLHCMRCHEVGVIERDDQLLTAVLENENAFDEVVVDEVQLLFPPNDEWADIYADDIAQFQRGLDELGVELGEEPTWALSEEHEAPMTVARVAAEFGIAEAALEPLIDSNDALSVQYSSLFNGSTAQLDRELLDVLFVDTVCDLGIGDTCPDEAQFCGLSSVPCLDGSICDAQGQCTKIAP